MYLSQKLREHVHVIVGPGHLLHTLSTEDWPERLFNAGSANVGTHDEHAVTSTTTSDYYTTTTNYPQPTTSVVSQLEMVLLILSYIGDTFKNEAERVLGPGEKAHNYTPTSVHTHPYAHISSAVKHMQKEGGCRPHPGQTWSNMMD